MVFRVLTGVGVEKIQLLQYSIRPLEVYFPWVGCGLMPVLTWAVHEQ